MTSVFRTAGAWGAGLGRPLTWVEQDNNIYDKEVRLAELESPTAGAGPVGIDHITVSGNQMTIHMTDSSIQGPFELPTAAWSAKGEWQPSSLYQALDVVTYGGSGYLINADHTSATSFDPNETTTAGPLYTLLWSFAPLPGFEISTPTITPTLLHANSYVRLTNASGCVVSIDPAEGFADWTEITFRDASTDTGASCTFEVATPGSIDPSPGSSNESFGSGSTVMLKKVGATDVWDIMGKLNPTTA